MALLERLQILIDADAKGAVRELDKAGTAADRLDAKLEKGAAKTSARLTSIGTKAAIGGAAVLGGLYRLAQASDDAEKQQLKLENSIKNSDRAFSNGGKALKDLAQGLQQVTAADGDAIVGAQSLLVQFGLTEKQVKTITPLVVDLSRKLGIDLDAAAKMVGKSIGGSAGALKKAGIDIDATRLKTDAFGATVDALAGSVGGFARQEGATFAGQIQILKNGLGDLGESVGKGAATVFASVATDAAKAAGALNQVNPAILESAGGIAAVGASAITVAGSFAFAAGQVGKIKTAFTNAEQGGLTSLGKIGAAVTAVVGTFVALEAAASIFNSVNNIAERTTESFDNIRNAVKGTDAELLDAVGSLTDVYTNTRDIAFLWESFGAKADIGGFVGNVEAAEKALSDTLDTFGPETAQRLNDELVKYTSGLDKNSEAYRTNSDLLAKNQTQINARRVALGQLAVDERDQKKSVQESIDTYDKEQATLEGIQKTLAAYEQKVRSLDDAYEVAQAGAKAFGDAIERGSQLDDIAGAAVNLGDKLRDVNTDLAALPKNFQDAFDPTKITEGSSKAITSLLAIGDAATKQFQTLVASGNEGFVPVLAQQYRDLLTKALQQAGIPPEQIRQYLGLAGLSDEQIQVALKVTQVEEQLALVKQRLALFQTDLSDAPQEVRVAIDKALVEGKLDEVNRLIETRIIGRKTVEVDVKYVASPLEQQFNTRGVTAERTAQRQGRRRALGGPLAKGQRSTVNEMGAEMFVPSSSGFVMDSDDSKALVRGVEAMLAGGGGNTFNITTTDPVLTATEVVRKQRDAAYLIGR